MDSVISFEMLPWEMNGIHLSGFAPVRVLISDGRDLTIKTGLGPGYWKRIKAELAELRIADPDGVLPNI